MSIYPMPLPKYYKKTRIVKSQNWIEENIEVDGELWYLEKSSYTTNDDLWITHTFFTVEECDSSKQTKKPYPRDEDWEEGITN